MTTRQPDKNVQDVDDVFADAVLTQVAEARLRLGEAAATADSHALAEALDELEDALALARESGIDVPRDGERGDEGAGR